MTIIDDIIKDWGERLYTPPVKGRKGKNIRSGGRIKPAQPAAKPNGPATRENVRRTARKTPEVMVKISGGGRNMRQIKPHFDYISRNGKVEIEDENGDIHLGKETVRDVLDAWAKGRIGIPYESEKRKEAFNFILSMPPGTDRQSVKDAARAFAREQFGNHQYVFAAHDDENHPHVHLTVKAVDNNGIRMNPRKGDLQFWREQFAEKLREQGIEADATPRRARGIVQKAERQVQRHMDNEFKQGKRKEPSRISQAQVQDAKLEAEAGEKRSTPARDNIRAARKDMLYAYGEIAKALARGNTEDQRLALDIVQLVRTMPPVITKHEQLVDTLRNKTKINEPEKAKASEERAKPNNERER